MKSFVGACVLLGLLWVLYFLIDSPDHQIRQMIRQPTMPAQYQRSASSERIIEKSASIISEADTNNEAFEFGERCMWTPGLSMTICSTMCLSSYRETKEYKSCKEGMLAPINSMLARRANQDKSERQVTTERKAEGQAAIEQQAEANRRAKLSHQTTPNSE